MAVNRVNPLANRQFFQSGDPSRGSSKKMKTISQVPHLSKQLNEAPSSSTLINSLKSRQISQISKSLPIDPTDRFFQNKSQKTS